MKYLTLVFFALFFCLGATAQISLSGQIISSDISIPVVQNVTVELVDANGNIVASTTTNNNSYQLSNVNLAQGQMYRLRASGGGPVLEEVSTFDMVLLVKHILGLQPLTNPYQYFAGDVNEDGTISLQDIIYMRMVILNMIEDFPTGKSWTLLDHNYQFNSNEPLSEYQQASTIEVVNTNNTDLNNLDFLAIKLGHINY